MSYHRFASLKSLVVILAALFVAAAMASQPPKGFVTVKDGHFSLDGKPYYYVGTNMWYAPILASEGQGGDRERLARELDTLQALGITNLRILVGAEGPSPRPAHIEPVLQPRPGEYNDTLLAGLDYLLAQLEERDMKAVLYLNNAWEWSGGYSAYLEWTGHGRALIPSADGYEPYTEYVGQFVLSPEAMALALNHARAIASRTNTLTGRPYAASPAIMAWQVCNEPRSFTTEGKEALLHYCDTVASLLHAIDPNHLVSTGSEGLYGCHVDLDLWRRIHSLPSIDYGILHLWPTNWQWADSATLRSRLDSVKALTDWYVGAHVGLLPARPLVLEEFGYPRDSKALAPGSSVTARDTFYDYVLKMCGPGRRLDGCNFWGWGGEAVPRHSQWQRWDPYTGDPAQEPQGLFSVFTADSTTVRLLQRHARRVSGR